MTYSRQGRRGLKTEAMARPGGGAARGTAQSGSALTIRAAAPLVFCVAALEFGEDPFPAPPPEEQQIAQHPERFQVEMN
jgi:hypothetical protein